MLRLFLRWVRFSSLLGEKLTSINGASVYSGKLYAKKGDKNNIYISYPSWEIVINYFGKEVSDSLLNVSSIDFLLRKGGDNERAKLLEKIFKEQKSKIGG